MSEQSQSPDDLYPFARSLVMQLVKRYQLRWDSHRIEDAIQDLFLAGWQVWCDEEDVGLAKNRMTGRQKNLLRDYSSKRRHEPRSETSLPELEEGVPGYLERDKRRSKSYGDPVEEALVNDLLDAMPERRRQIVQLQMAAYTNKEIAKELGISLRTVERELFLAREEYTHGE